MSFRSNRTSTSTSTSISSTLAKGLEEAVKAATATDIVRQITHTREWTAQMVMEIFCKQALEAQDDINPLTQHWMERAIRQAKALDAEFARTGVPRGPLHGVPLSVKEQIDVLGTDATLGFSKFLGDPAPQSALVIRILESAGAIPFCKTNLPQGNIAFETSNPVYGTTLHPMNPSLSPGGSSGGEAALIASCGSPLGLGTDIEGGLRIPASFCGLYALKPSSNRIPIQGVRNNIGGCLTLCLGPIGTSVADLARLVETIVDSRPWTDDATTLPIPWAIDNATDPPRFGYYTDDGLIRASPACARAVTTAVQALQAAGYECVPFQPPDVPSAVATYYALLTADGLATASGAKGHDPVDPALAPLLAGPRGLRGVIAQYRRARGDDALPSFMAGVHTRSVVDLYALQRTQLEYQSRFHALKQADGIDCIIAPVHALPAVTHGTFSRIPFGASYAVLYNLLDYAAGVVPVTTVDPAVDAPCEGTGARWTEYEKAVYRHYDAHLFADVPVGVQIVTGRLQEERCLNMMSLVDGALALSKGKTTDAAQAEAGVARSRRHVVKVSAAYSGKGSNGNSGSRKTVRASVNGLKNPGHNGVKNPKRRVSFADDLNEEFSFSSA
ncbi:glutaminyl-tRNA synthase (glutamine-hydrolysing) [Synchytrium endobioticum]|uniref:Glutaminyl-tRNA synthase (Glutamine-hydrolysing) n=1 Tax=Synchytrium endobioticum TaxID=286115 RepID=A0A507BUE3_9FUNG|nr:glutaminyl-tRNA synthase (glutamine-hydrolysing) [Synchytrium endobioticum]